MTIFQSHRKRLNFTILILIHIFHYSFMFEPSVERLIMHISISFLLITHWSRNFTESYKYINTYIQISPIRPRLSLLCINHFYYVSIISFRYWPSEHHHPLFHYPWLHVDGFICLKERLFGSWGPKTITWPVISSWIHKHSKSKLKSGSISLLQWKNECCRVSKIKIKISSLKQKGSAFQFQVKSTQ